MGGPDDEEILPEDEIGQFVEDDARSSDDTGGPDHTGPEDSEGQAEEGLAPPQSRGERHFGKLRSEVRAASERAARLEQELAELRQRSQQPQQPQIREESDEEFLARISILGPEQQTREVIGRNNRLRQMDLQRHQQELLRTQLQMADQSDRMAFQARVASEPILKRVAKDVEDVLRFERQRGRDFDRETVANYLLGKAWRESAGKVRQAKQTGQDNIRRQQARPDAGRSDVRPERRADTRNNLEKRLEGVYI